MDLIGNSSREARFPEKLIKRLNDRLERIIKGQDPANNDSTLRSTMARFYTTFKEDGFQRQIKSNRKIEELILIFVTKAQETLKKGQPGQRPLGDEELKAELNKQVGQFIRIIRECLDSLHGVPKELRDRLDSYQSKLVPKSAGGSTLSGTASGSSSSSGGPLQGNGATATTPAPLSEDSRRTSSGSNLANSGGDPVKDSELIRSVGLLFEVDTEQLGKDVDFMRKTCTEQAAMMDLKQCVKNVNLQASWPGRKEDFGSEEAYQQWRSQELHSLSHIMMEMCQANPELLKTTSGDATSKRRNTESGSAPPEVAAAAEAGEKAPDAETISQAIEEDDTAVDLANFTYIPPDPKAYYRRTLELCIDFDLEKIKQQPEEEEVSLSILSRQHVELLNQCAQRWRLTSQYRTISTLSTMANRYDRGEVPLDCVSEALTTVQGTLSELDAEKWAVSDHALLVKTSSALFESFLRYLYEALQDIHNVDPTEIAPYVALTEELHASQLVRTNQDVKGTPIDLDRHVEELKDGIRIAAIHEYTTKTTELFSQVVENEIVPLVQLVDWLERNAKRLDKKYKEPLLGSIDPVMHVLEKQVPLFLDDLESMKQQILQHAMQDRSPLGFDDIFMLYGRVNDLLRMHKAFCPENELLFSVSTWFEPHIRHWLATTDRKTSEWVNNAIASDSFVPLDATGAVHSSSIDDLFGALQQPLEFIQSLNWSDEFSFARFMTQLSRSISRSIELYCHRVEELFMDEILAADGSADASTTQKQSAWMVKAKQTLQGAQKVEPFLFQETSCVKLNNIEAARLLLDKLYHKIDADRQAQIIREQGDAGGLGPSMGTDRQRFIFTIKIVLGESLQPIRETSARSRIDSFVTLSDERGNKIAKTRTIYETPDPRWDEAFDIPVEKSMWLAATVWDRKLVGDHNLCGRAFLRLDPRYFGDFLAHDLWLDLDTQGRLLARVSMEGERDDILFYFGRAFRSLKRAESDMVRTIVDKMSIFIRQCLSRSVLKSLVRTSGINLDKALGNVKALYAQALASTSANTAMIPPVEAEAPKKQRPAQLTDQEIEAAIAPLLDYLHECLGTLKSSLSDSQAELVMTKVWKEVLNTIDGILLPPLSDAPSDMPQLSGKEVEVVFKWLSFLRNFFNAYDEETATAHGVPLEILQGPKYREIVAYTLYHDSSSDALMEACVREMQQRLRNAPTKRTKNKSVMQQRSLGTIKKRKQDKKVDEEAHDNLEREYFFDVLEH